MQESKAKHTRYSSREERRAWWPGSAIDPVPPGPEEKGPGVSR